MNSLEKALRDELTVLINMAPIYERNLRNAQAQWTDMSDPEGFARWADALGAVIRASEVIDFINRMLRDYSE